MHLSFINFSEIKDDIKVVSEFPYVLDTLYL